MDAKAIANGAEPVKACSVVIVQVYSNYARFLSEL